MLGVVRGCSGRSRALSGLPEGARTQDNWRLPSFRSTYRDRSGAGSVVIGRCYASLPPFLDVRPFLTARSSSPTPHTNSSPHTPSSIAQMPVHLCNVQPQSSAPSTSSLNFPPAHQSLLPTSSPGVIPQTRPPFSDRPRLPLPESLQPPRASTHPGAASRSVSLSPASIPAAPASLFSAKLSARGKFRAILR